MEMLAYLFCKPLVSHGDTGLAVQTCRVPGWPTGSMTYLSICLPFPRANTQTHGQNCMQVCQSASMPHSCTACSSIVWSCMFTLGCGVVMHIYTPAVSHNFHVVAPACLFLTAVSQAHGVNCKCACMHTYSIPVPQYAAWGHHLHICHVAALTRLITACHVPHSRVAPVMPFVCTRDSRWWPACACCDTCHDSTAPWWHGHAY